MGQADSHLYFTHDEKGVCYCQDCKSFHLNLRNDLALYERHGLQLQHGMTIELEHCKKAADIMLERLRTLHQPSSLEVLAGMKVDVPCTRNPDDLPLPKSIIQNIAEGYYQSQQMGEFTRDPEYYSALACKLPGILWYHMGCKLVCDGTRHPNNRY